MKGKVLKKSEKMKNKQGKRKMPLHSFMRHIRILRASEAVNRSAKPRKGRPETATAGGISGGLVATLDFPDRSRRTQKLTRRQYCRGACYIRHFPE